MNRYTYFFDYHIYYMNHIFDKYRVNESCIR